MIKTIIKLLTFIPWILYFVEIMYYRIAVIESKDLNKEKYLNYSNKHLFNTINTKELFLFLLFIVFMQFRRTVVLEILFTTIYIYLLIDFFMSLAASCKKIKYKSIMVQTVILIVLVILYFLIFNKLYTTYNLMFAFSIMSPVLVYLFSYYARKKISDK